MVLAQNCYSVIERGEEVSFKDTIREYALRLNFTGEWVTGNYNLWIDDVAYDSLDDAPE